MSRAHKSEELLSKLCCPETRAPLIWGDEAVVTPDGLRRYKLSPSGIPLFADETISPEAKRQRDHYDSMFACQYAANLEYPHTQEYMAYLDRVFVEQVDTKELGDVAELCCGQGELPKFAQFSVSSGIGVDISPAMLEVANAKFGGSGQFMFVQGDATRLPLADSQFTSVFMFGGVHHVSDRRKLFSEVFRILKPGGRFYFREPVSDFFLWRGIRAIVYRLSPALDADTERPLLWRETVPVLERAGFKLKSWRTYGLLGFCFFMNSDVLVFNRLFRFVPGIRRITRLWTRFDDFVVRVPGLHRSGLQVVGVAEKPRQARQ